MSTARGVARKLRAWEVGRPLPRYDTIHKAIAPADRSLVVAFVRMAGESRPWGIAWGLAGSTPTIRSVPDARRRDDVAVLCAAFAEDLLAHLRVHNWTFDPAPEQPANSDLRQVWLPNGQHLAMLHQLNYTYSQTKHGGEHQDVLRALGRLAGWMFRDTSRAGHQHVVDASALLADSYVFPAQDARTAHLGYQLAWLTDLGDREARMTAASEAEHLTISPTMDPARERDQLSPLVDAFQADRRAGVPTASATCAIAEILAEELQRRWNITVRAHALMAHNERPVNPGVEALITQAHAEFWREHQRIELRLNDPAAGPAFVPHPETDFHGSAAASRYLANAAADEAYTGQLIHDDPALLTEALDDGHAFEGTVISVTDIGEGRVSKPRWRLRMDPSRPNRLRENGRLTPYGSRGHEATVVSIDATENEVELVVEWTTRKTKPLARPLTAKPADPAWVGTTMVFVPSDASSLIQRRSQRVWSAAKGPGAWLTHGKASAPIEIIADDGATDLIVDDVAQIVDGVSA